MSDNKENLMGNTQSNCDNINKSNIVHIDNNCIDAEAINTKNIINNTKVSVNINAQTQNTTKYNKTYNIYQRINGIPQTFTLNIKIFDNNIFVYVTDIFTAKTFLAHVGKIHNDESECINMDPLNYLKYIQMSSDFKLISLPEDDTINIYDLTKLIDCNMLQYVDSTGIVLKIGEDNTLIMEIENNDSSTRIRPYKCILCKESFITVCINETNKFYDRIININYKRKSIHDVINLSVDKSSILNFSINCMYVAIYEKNTNKLSMCCLNDSNPIPAPISIDFDKLNVLDAICVSENGKLMCYVTKTEINMYDISQKKIYPIKIKINTSDQTTNSYHDTGQIQIKDVKFHLLNYKNFADIANIDFSSTNDNNNNNNLYTLIGWNLKLLSSFYWIIQYTSASKNEYTSYGPYSINITAHKDPNNNIIDYVYNNSSILLYKSQCGITVYDLNKVVPIRFVNILEMKYKSDIDNLLKKEYLISSNKYHKNLIIIGTDDSNIKYELSEYMMMFLSVDKSQQVHNNQLENKIENSTKNEKKIEDNTENNTEQNIFLMRVNANIDIYGFKKSFKLFQDLLEGKINQSIIIADIFTIRGETGRHNTMTELMNHFYEYTRVIALKENNSGDITRNEFNNMKALYIGYVLMILVLKYYSMVIKLVPPKIVHNNNNTYINFDILETFNMNFPAFKDFMIDSIELMISFK